jgi:hypothetical protein
MCSRVCSCFACVCIARIRGFTVAFSNQTRSPFSGELIVIEDDLVRPSAEKHPPHHRSQAVPRQSRDATR